MTVRIGVIGCGAIARRQHVPLLLAAGATVTAFASRSRASAEAAAAEAGTGVVCATWQELLARDDVDAVTICTPNAAHAEQAVAAARAGKHVLVEKPLAVTVAEADAIVAAGRAAGVVVMTAHSARFAPPVVALGAALSRIGTPASVEASLCHAGPAAWSATADWFTDPARAGGGALLDLGVHLVDTLRWLLADEVEEVAAVLAGAPVEQDGVVVLRTVGGVPGTLHAGWRSVAGPGTSLTVRGSEGTLVLDERGPVLHLPGREPEPLPLGTADSPQHAFVRAVGAGRAESPDAYDGRAAVAVVRAAYLAAEQRRLVRVEEAR